MGTHCHRSVGNSCAVLHIICTPHTFTLCFRRSLTSQLRFEPEILNDVEPAEDEERNYINVDDENKCVDMSYAVQRDNTRSWILFQGGLPSELGVKNLIRILKD